MLSYHLNDFSLKVVLKNKFLKKILRKNGANRTRVVTINKLSMHFVTKWYENRTSFGYIVVVEGGVREGILGEVIAELFLVSV